MKEKYEKLKDYYNSPRITGEVLDCSMPLTFDQYSNCGHYCMYCFSTFQRAIGKGKENYLKRKVKAVNVDKIKKMFLLEKEYPWSDYIRKRITMQWGGLSDPFCPIEEQLGVGKELLKFFNEINYPLSFSTKSTLMTRNPEYRALFEGRKNLSVKQTIITLDPKKAAILEANVPTPQERLENLRQLSEMGIFTTLRLRPFIIGVSSKDYRELIKAAAKAGVKSVSTEFFCLELRSINLAKEKYKIMSKACGFDIVDYYRKLSKGSGYLRLNYNVKRRYIEDMQELCDSLGLKFYVSDAHHKEKSCNGSCCGLPENDDMFKYSKGQFTEALVLCKRNGTVRWGEIAPNAEHLKSLRVGCGGSINGLNDGDVMTKAKFQKQSLFDSMHNIWNSPNNSKSPYRYFEGVMQPDGLDENGDVIYKYNPR